MALIIKNHNESNWYSHRKRLKGKEHVPYSSERRYLGRAAYNDSVNISQHSISKQHTNNIKPDISFKGSPVKISGFKKFFTGEKPVYGRELFADITKYISPADENLVHVLGYNVNHEKFGIANEKIRTIEPFHKNLFYAFASLPKIIMRTAVKLFGSKEAKKELEIKIKKENTRNRLLGLWMNVTKIASDFEKGITGEKNISELKNLASKGIKGKEEELSKFFEKRKLKDLYSFKDGKESGLLAKSDEKGHHLEGFIKEILGETPKSTENSFKEKAKKHYVKKTIDEKIISKQGSVLPNYGQSVTSLMARLVSGMIPAWFIAHDFYNLVMLNSDDKKKAKKEWQSKFKQESFRVIIEAYQGFILYYVFEKLTNKSLLAAVSLNIVNIIGSNSLSRVLTGRPVLPISMKKATEINKMLIAGAGNSNNSPAISGSSNNSDNKIKQFESYKSFKKTNPTIAFGANNKIIKFPAKMNLEKFIQNYERVKQLDEKDAKKMLEIVAEHAGMDKNKTTIEEFKKKSNGQKEIIIGRNWLYRYSKDAFNVIKFPIDFTLMLLKGIIINPVLKLFGKEPLKPKKGNSFYSEQFIKNVTKWADNVHEKMGVINDKNLEEAKGRYADKKNFFSTKVMEYGADQLSTAMKFTGFASVPFLAIDAYNVTIGETKNKEKAKKKSEQRAVQDSARQGISLWICYAFNNMGKVLSNNSLLGNAAVIATQTFTYESVTRLLVGQPLFPTTHKKMLEAEEKRTKSSNPLSKLMAGRLKTIKIQEPEETSDKKSDKQKEQTKNITSIKTVHSFTSTDHQNVSELYKKFALSSN